MMFEHPLVERYASRKMIEIFSQERKFKTWRKLWVALAEAQAELGLPITKEQIDELKANIDKLNLDVAERYEKEIRHDVVAHIKAYAEQCPKAGGIIHLGATSCYVTDNTDVILIKEALELLLIKIAKVLENLAGFARKYKDLPTLGFTHLQPAQPTTVGKRACLWAQDFLEDLCELERIRKSIKFRGVKGTTGTQDSFLKLFDGDEGKVKLLEKKVAEKMGFEQVYLITGQTYPRKQDSKVMYALCSLAESAHKFASDLRILQHLGEMEEPFLKKQVGSSAMPYKRNPMRSERICALSRYLIALVAAFPHTAASQWMERTLDDSAVRRIAIPEAFFAADGILELCMNVTSNLVVYQKVIERHLDEKIGFLAAEEIMMRAVKRGKDRQTVHSRIREHAMKALGCVKDGKENPFVELVSNDPHIGLSYEEIKELIKPSRFIGRAPSQVEEFLQELYSAIEPYKERLDIGDEVKV